MLKMSAGDILSAREQHRLTLPGWLRFLPAWIAPYVVLTRIHYFNWPDPGPIFWASGAHHPFKLWTAYNRITALGLILGATEAKVGPKDLVKQGMIYYFAAVIYHGAGSIWNDIIDKDLDVQVGMSSPAALSNSILKSPKSGRRTDHWPLESFRLVMQFL